MPPRRAEPSRKAAFEAWGSDRDLFGRGLAEQVTDENLTRHAFVNRAIRSSRSACGSAGFDVCRSRPRAMKYGLSEVARGRRDVSHFRKKLDRVGATTNCSHGVRNFSASTPNVFVQHQTT